MSGSTGVAVGVVIEKDGELLCVRHVKGGKWGLPAGHLEPGEMVIDGVKREVREETGYEIAIFGLLGVYNRPKKDSVRVAFVFTACLVDKKGEPRASEIAELKWFSRDEVRALLSSDQLYKPVYAARTMMDWLEGTVYPVSVFKEVR